MLNHRSKCHHCHISNYLYPQTCWTLGHKHRTSNCPTGQTSEYHQTSSIQMEDTQYKHSGREIIHGVLIKQACCSSHANHDHQHSTIVQLFRDHDLHYDNRHQQETQLHFSGREWASRAVWTLWDETWVRADEARVRAWSPEARDLRGQVWSDSSNIQRASQNLCVGGWIGGRKIFCKPYFLLKAPNHVLAEGLRPSVGRTCTRGDGAEGPWSPSETEMLMKKYDQIKNSGKRVIPTHGSSACLAAVPKDSALDLS